MISESPCNDEGFVRDFDWGQASVVRLRKENPTANLHEIGQMFADEILGQSPGTERGDDCYPGINDRTLSGNSTTISR